MNGDRVTHHSLDLAEAGAGLQALELPHGSSGDAGGGGGGDGHGCHDDILQTTILTQDQQVSPKTRATVVGNAAQVGRILVLVLAMALLGSCSLTFPGEEDDARTRTGISGR